MRLDSEDDAATLVSESVEDAAAEQSKSIATSERPESQGTDGSEQHPAAVQTEREEEEE
jgi:hypothetical protein